MLKHKMVPWVEHSSKIINDFFGETFCDIAVRD